MTSPIPLSMRLPVRAMICMLLACTGCMDPATDVEVVFENTAAPAMLADPGLLRVRLEAAGRVYRIAGSDLRTNRYATPHSNRLSLPSDGEMIVTVALVLAPSDTLGSVLTRIALQPDYQFGVSIKPGGRRPQGVCVGALVLAPLRRPGAASATDTLWVSVGGLPRGAIC